MVTKNISLKLMLNSLNSRHKGVQNLEKMQKTFLKDFFKLTSNVAFGKTISNVEKHGGVKVMTTAKRRN